MQISNKADLIHRFRELFNYDERYPTCLSWKMKRKRSRNVGDMAGWVEPHGYWNVCVDGKKVGAHRVVYALHHGELPKLIDHIDMDKSNNKISNLRSATYSQNECNKGIRADNSSGVKGVSWDVSCRLWRARVTLNGKTKTVGLFKSVNLAAKAIRAERENLHENFARHSA